MSEAVDACAALAQTLVDHPSSQLPYELPCEPLALLIELHRHVVATMATKPSRAKRAAELAGQLADRSPDDALIQAQAHWSQGSAVLYKPDYITSLAHYDAAIACYMQACQQAGANELQPDVRIVQAVRVFCLSELGRHDQALHAVALCRQWLDTHREHAAFQTVQLTLLLNQSQLASRMGNHARVIELADKTLQVALAQGNSTRAAQAWVNRANACIQLGRFDEASDALTQGAAAAEQAGDRLIIGRAYLNRAQLLRLQGQLFDALLIVRDAEEQLIQAPNEIATVARFKAELYEQLHALREARDAAHRAAQLYQAQAMPVYAATAALGSARIAVRASDLDFARRRLADTRALLEQARSVAEDLRPEYDHLSVLQAQVALVEAQLASQPLRTKAERQARQTALANAQAAIKVLARNGLVHEAVRGQLCVAALQSQLGKTQAARARENYRQLRTHSDPHVQLEANAGLGMLLPSSAALPFLQRAADIAVTQRRTLLMEELQARYSSETSPHHLRLAAHLFELGDVMRAFETVCAAKSGAMLDLRAATDAPEQEAMQLNAVKAQFAHWRSLTQPEPILEMAASAYRRHESGDVRQFAEDSAQELVDLMRTLGVRAGQAEVPDGLTIQQVLPPGTLLLEYAQFGDELVCFLVPRQGAVICQRLGPYHELAALLDQWSIVRHRLLAHSALPRDAYRRILQAMEPLWHKLIAPCLAVLKESRDLVIAPFGMLHHIPWGLLTDGHTYLRDLVTITLVPSGGLWAAPLEAVPVGPPRVLGCAGKAAHRLEHVAAEVAAIRRFLPDAYSSLEATSADLRSVPSPSILHIAAHGQTNSSMPLFSTIELADGPFLLLLAHRLRLRGTRLVVLSACETGERPDYGDMALALAGAFLCAGARATVASLWKVDDSATNKLMEYFYAALSTNVPAAAALQQAQRQLHDEHPLAWSAFQLWAGAPWLPLIQENPSAGVSES